MGIQAAETSQPSNSSLDLPGCVFGPAARTDEGAFELQAAAVGGGAVWRGGYLRLDNLAVGWEGAKEPRVSRKSPLKGELRSYQEGSNQMLVMASTKAASTRNAF